VWKRYVNTGLRHTIGYELARPAGHQLWRLPPGQGGRLLAAPVFILCAARSGSTLLRAVLGSHSQLYAPPEIPLRHLTAEAGTPWIQASLAALRLTGEDLDYLLWDRVIADALRRSGKPTAVVKTPSNVLIWQRIAACWPDARFIFLLRHPAAAVRSLHAAWDPAWHPGEEGTLDEAIGKGLRYMTAVEEARRALPGFTIRYEDLAASPEAAIRPVCDFLGVPFEPAMLDYGQFADHRFVAGLGDASEKIRSGRIQAAVPPPRPADVPAELREMCATWGYLGPAADAGPASAAGTGLAGAHVPYQRASHRDAQPEQH
jgi:LPS sulfotransferase NodH